MVVPARRRRAVARRGGAARHALDEPAQHRAHAVQTLSTVLAPARGKAPNLARALAGDARPDRRARIELGAQTGARARGLQRGDSRPDRGSEAQRALAARAPLTVELGRAASVRRRSACDAP